MDNYEVVVPVTGWVRTIVTANSPDEALRRVKKNPMEFGELEECRVDTSRMSYAVTEWLGPRRIVCF